ncbi:MAG: hypothetical protein KBD01_16495 [Acidobacteria bacterium]|nr:hypothetical protein [Acidobacteriota bacterium]
MRRTLLVGLALGLALATAPAARGADAIFKLDDPRGDDHGDGRLLYPNRDDLVPGDLDLLSFAARAVKGGTEFEAVFARPVHAPGDRTIDIGGGSIADIARFGFYTFNVEVYIDTDRLPGSGRTDTLPGRRLAIAPEYAWERAVALVPRPYQARDGLKTLEARREKRQLKESAGRVTTAQSDEIKAQAARAVEGLFFFPTRIKVAGPKIRFFVPAEFLGGPARPDWAYVVLVTGADVEQKFDVMSALGVTKEPPPQLMVLPIGLGRFQDQFGGGREDDLDLQSPVVDMIVPAGTTQEQLLQRTDPVAGTFAQVPGIVPDKAAEPVKERRPPRTPRVF